MSSPLRKKKKIHQQLTLFGGVAKGQAVHAKVSDLYERSVDAFVFRYLQDFRTKAEAVSRALTKWGELKDEKDEIEKFITDVEIYAQETRSDDQR